MRIAVTNDDGVHAPGIAQLARFLADAGHDLIICAPDHEMSGSGASTGGDLTKPGGTEIVDVEIAGLPAHRVCGPPALCSLLALRGAFGPRPDLIISGINPGLNLGPSVLHSGTVGAVLTAGNFGVPGIAVSVDAPPNAPDEIWRTAATLALLVAQHAWAAGDHFVGNLNVPGVSLEELRGIRTTVLDRSPGFRATGVAETRLGEGRRSLRFNYERTTPSQGVASDVAAVSDGYASISWLRAISDVEPPAWSDDLDDLLAASVARSAGRQDPLSDLRRAVKP